LLTPTEVEPDLALEEVISEMRKHKIPSGCTVVWRFFQRHKITFKKRACAAQRERANVARAEFDRSLL